MKPALGSLDWQETCHVFSGNGYLFLDVMVGIVCLRIDNHFWEFAVGHGRVRILKNNVSVWIQSKFTRLMGNC